MNQPNETSFADLFYALRLGQMRMAQTISFLARMLLLCTLLSLGTSGFLLYQYATGWPVLLLGAMTMANLALALLIRFLLPTAQKLLENSLEVPEG